jgi:hypothetical protein
MPHRPLPRRPSAPTLPRRRPLLLTVALVTGTALLPPGIAAAAPLHADSVKAPVAVLHGGATIVPGRSGLVEIGGYQGAALPAGSSLTLTAPARTRITGTPLADTAAFRGSVSADGTSGSYTYVRDSRPGSWRDGGYPFVLTVDERAVPGTRLPGCSVVLTDAGGTRRASGSCTVTAGMREPTLNEPAGGTFVSGGARISGTSYPGARVSVMDAAEHEVCGSVAHIDGTWSCTPEAPLPEGADRLHARAVFNGVSAVGEDVDFTVTGRTG